MHVHASSDWYTMQENNTDHLPENAPPHIRIERNLAQRALYLCVHLCCVCVCVCVSCTYAFLAF